MEFRLVAEAFRDIEGASGRHAMVDRLARLFRSTPVEMLPTVVRLTQGRIAAEFNGVEVGLAGRLGLRLVADAAGVEIADVARLARETGDIGAAAERLLSSRPDRPVRGLDVMSVVAGLAAAAGCRGAGAQDAKLARVNALLLRASPLEARYLVRIAGGNLRLGAGAATLIDALAVAFAGGRASRTDIERAYNVVSDLGLVAATVADGGVVAVRRLRIRPGSPVRPMLAQRLAAPGEVLDRLGGRCAAELKYDGERVQVHRTGDQVDLFSRRLERITDQYPDVVAAVLAGLLSGQAILEGEIVSYDDSGGRMRPFQDLMRRRRIHGVADAAAAFPATLVAFDLLFDEGRDLTGAPFVERRRRLEAALTGSDRLRLADHAVVEDQQALERRFQQALRAGCEGLVCKALDAPYQAGARGWAWIKLKRDYLYELRDTFDLVVVGASHGRGKRTGTYGSVLLAAYNDAEDRFESFCRCGTGFTDASLAELRRLLEPLETQTRPARVHSRVVPDIWCQPEIVLEVTGAEVTVSPVHTAGWGSARRNAGLALRFPRFTGRFRPDKGPEDATTVEEILALARSPRPA